ncbi:MAG: hypothetical protein AAGJ81_03650, partial [Verrucomicrobiota bacterium]
LKPVNTKLTQRTLSLTPSRGLAAFEPQQRSSDAHALLVRSASLRLVEAQKQFSLMVQTNRKVL